jgi:hypothetical protein
MFGESDLCPLEANEVRLDRFYSPRREKSSRRAVPDYSSITFFRVRAYCN